MRVMIMVYWNRQVKQNNEYGLLKQVVQVIVFLIVSNDKGFYSIYNIIYVKYLIVYQYYCI